MRSAAPSARKKRQRKRSSMADPRFCIVITDRRGNVRTGLDVWLLDAETGERFKKLTEAPNSRGTYFCDYGQEDAQRLYRLEIDGVTDDARGAFYLGGAVPIGAGGGDLFHAVAGGALSLCECVSISGFSGGLPVVARIAINDINSPDILAGLVSGRGAQPGERVIVRRYGVEPGYIVDGCSIGGVLWVGSDGFPSPEPPPYNNVSIKCGICLGANGIYVIRGESVG